MWSVTPDSICQNLSCRVDGVATVLFKEGWAWLPLLCATKAWAGGGESLWPGCILVIKVGVEWSGCV